MCLFNYIQNENEINNVNNYVNEINECDDKYKYTQNVYNKKVCVHYISPINVKSSNDDNINSFYNNEKSECNYNVCFDEGKRKNDNNIRDDKINGYSNNNDNNNEHNNNNDNNNEHNDRSKWFYIKYT